MYIEVQGQRAFASTGGKDFDNTMPVVGFLCGSAIDHTFWALHSRFFAFRGYAVLVPDMPGHSNSEGPDLATIEDMAGWLSEFLQATGAGNVSIVGHSMGCLTALDYVSRFGDDVRSVSFIGSGLATPVNPALIEAAEKTPEKAVAMMNSWGFGEAGHLHQGAVPGNSMLGAGIRTMMKNAASALANDLKACDAYGGGKVAAAAIRCPQQVILGGKDRMTPRKAGLQLVEHLGSPELHVIENSGHMVPVEAPDQCRTLLRNFIFKHNPGKPV